MADIAWVLISTAFVLLVTPALGFFYGGLVRAKNALNTMRMSLVSLAVVGVLWAVLGYSLAFSPGSAFLGGLAAAPGYFAILYRARTRLDDSLDVVAAHGVGGLVGALLTGVFASKAWGAPADGLLHGNPKQFLIQAAACAVTILYSGAATYLILKAVAALSALKAAADKEAQGMDVNQHGEEAYTTGEGALLVLSEFQPEGGSR